MNVEWTGPAERDMRRLDREIAARVRSAVLRYAATGLGNVKRLEGHRRAVYRLRVGDWRVLFTLEYSTDTMAIARVLPRSEAYR